jgi:chemotaxis protein MotB
VDRYKRTGELENENAELRRELDQAKEEKVTELEKARRDLAKAFEKELGEYKAKLEMTERGLVITFLAEVFFDPGKDVVLSDGKPVLDKIAKVLNQDVPNSRVAVEGHTDADPIKYSGWKSNWELSSARALAVLHYFVDEAAVKPDRLSANAYGEYSPIASNDTASGKKKNRRVEIVILPSSVSKVKASE